MALSSEQGAYLVSLARRTVETTTTERRPPRREELPPWPEADAFLKEPRGAFVTLTDGEGSLRGCIGLPYPVRPLWEAVVEAAGGAAARDPRFDRVTPGELPSLRVEVSALTVPQPLRCKTAELPSHVKVGTDGLIVSGEGTSGLLLPQVAAEMNLSPEDFLSLTCQKAGLQPGAWRTGRVEVLSFQAEVFGETTAPGTSGEVRAE